MGWNEFIQTIDFEKIKSIRKGVKDENMEEGLKVRNFLKYFLKKLQNENEFLKTYEISVNQAPTQQFWSEGNGFRVGFYKGESYKDSTQINLTIGASWGGGIFIKDNENLIFGNFKLLSSFEKQYCNLNFNKIEKHIGAIWFQNKIGKLPNEKEVIIVIKKLSEIFEIMIKVNKMKEKINIVEYQKQIILQGPPGTGKTRLAKQIANFIINGDTSPEISQNKKQIKLIQFHPSYSYEDFVRGIVAKANGTQIEYKAEDKILAEMAIKAKETLKEKGYYDTANKDEKDKILKEVPKYILIIDEINRANLSSVLGELIYALEYRDEAVESMYEVDGSKEIILPSNLYIIGTMNTADRSIGHIDYAIRRRFAFESILPDEESINLQKGKELFNKIKNLFKTDGNKIASTLSPEFNPDDVMLGHSYFIADNEEELENKLKYQVIPLLKEYVKDGVLNESALKEIESL